VTQELFDRALYVSRQRRREGGEPNILLQTVADELIARLNLIKRSFASPCIIAPDPDFFIRMLRAEEAAGFPLQSGTALPLGAADHDAIFSLLDLHTIDDVPGYLAQIARALKPDGLFIGCLFAGETLKELRQAWYEAETSLHGGVTPRVAPMIDVRELGGLLQRANLALPVADVDRHVVRYSDPLSLMREIKILGCANCLRNRSRKPVTRRLLLQAAETYAARAQDADGRIRATLEIAWATAWSPHENQQKPLRPGSAKVRRADALKVREQPLKRD
jgi:SAM-dependent methyltransferase